MKLLGPFRTLIASRSGAFGVFAVAILICVALAAPLAAPYDPNAIHPVDRLQDPSAAHIFGTDHLGRDLFSRIVYGARVAISVAFMVIAISLSAGVVLGVAAAFAPQAADQLVVSLFDVVNSFPSIILALALVAVLGSGLGNTILLISIVFVPHFGRVARAQTLTIRNSAFLEAERVLGVGFARVLIRHVLPNIIGPIFVLASMDVPVVITLEAGLSFLGVGIRPPLASWGGMLNDGYHYLDQSPWPAIAAGGSLMVATLGFTLLGESLQRPHRSEIEAGAMTTGIVADIDGLNVTYQTEKGRAHALRDVSIALSRDRATGLVGESGSGKSTLALAIMGLLPGNAIVSAARFVVDGRDVRAGGARVHARLRGRSLAMVFQDPMSSLNPLFSIGRQMTETQLVKHPRLARSELRARAQRMLTRVGVPDAEQRMKRYPHEFSGGMRQRVMIAMALLVEPQLLIADEPTTALDATIEAQVAELLREIRSQVSGTTLLVSHSLGLVSELCEDVAVMYAGRIVERGPVDRVFGSPRHPYTRALLDCEIDLDEPVGGHLALRTIPGSVPDAVAGVAGCPFAARCPHRHERCVEVPPMIPAGPDHSAACWLT